MTATQATRTQGTQMIDRTVALMRLVATYCPRGARLTDLAEESGLPAPTARRILKRLVDHRLIAQDGSKRRYTLGQLALEFGLSASHVTEARARYGGVIAEIAETTGHTVYLLLRSGLDCVCADRIDLGSKEKCPTLQVGDRLPLGVGVGGMALLAALPEAEAESVIAANEAVYRRFRRTTGASFRDHLEAARRAGHVMRRSPVTPGIVGFGIALPNPDGAPYAAISTATAASELTEELRMETLATVRKLVAQSAAASG